MVKEAFKIKWVRVQEQLPYSELRDCVDRLGLPKVWLQESERFAQVPDRLRYVAGRRLRLEYLRMYGFDLELHTAFKEDANGRPYFPEGPDFNISHSGGWIGMATHAQHRVGFDVEKHRSIDPALFTRQFSPLEMQAILHSESEKTAFFEAWSKKESVMKADGRGMRIPLHSIALKLAGANLDGQQWHCVAVNPMGHPGGKFIDHSASLCSEVEIEAWESEVELW